MKYNIIFPLLAMVGYAIANVIIDEKLSKTTNSLNIVIIYSGMTALLCFIARQFMKTNDVSWNMPTGSILLYCMAIGILFCFADYFFATAYTNGASLLTITPIVALVPVFSALIKLIVTGEMPNIWHICGFVTAIVSVILVSKGNAK